MNNLYQLSNVSFNYGDAANTVTVLSNIHLDLKPSKMVAIVGPNGSGKTTLLNMLAFLSLPEMGKLTFKGNTVDKLNVNQCRKAVGYVQQNPYLLRGNAFKNIELGLKLNHVDKAKRHKKVTEIMQLLDISDLANRTAGSLSGGEAQKVAIGQVLALEPEVLVLDEPFNHLDKDAVNDLEKIVIRLNNELDKTIIFTTHDQIQAQSLADEIYTVVGGKLFEAHLVNLFTGVFDVKSKTFKTPNLSISISDGVTQADQIAIDPKQIVVSNEELDSSMQNSFSGKITGMNEENGNVKLNVNIGENIQATITHKALQQLKLSIGSNVWVSFKSSSIVVF